MNSSGGTLVELVLAFLSSNWKQCDLHRCARKYIFEVDVSYFRDLSEGVQAQLQG